MAEPDKQQMGDGHDNYGHAAQQVAKAAKQATQTAAKKGAEAAAKGAEAATKAAAASVQAGMEAGGSAVSNIAVGTASGGPWGAIIAAAWSMRKTLFKVLICICLVLVFLIVIIVSLPSIIWDYLFGTDDSPPVQNVSITDVYNEMADAVSVVINEGLEHSMSEVEDIIEENGYDYDLCMEKLVNYAQSSAGYDTCYILAAYSASMGQRNTSKDDMISKLSGTEDRMFPVTYEEFEQEVTVPASYTTYTAVMVTHVTRQTQTGEVNGEPVYEYETERSQYYRPSGEETTDTEIEVDAYTEVELTIPIYSQGHITGTRTETYYEPNGTETVTPGTDTIKYAEFTIHPFDNSVILDAFDIDPDEQYQEFTITYGEVIQKMADSLKMTLYGALGDGAMVPLTDAELIAFVARQECSPVRKHLLETALSLVGRVPYFWGGKSAPGWNSEWNTPKVVTSAGSSTTGTIRPYGLDCSGFSHWTYNTALGVDITHGVSGQYANSTSITEAELLPGDLGCLKDSDGSWNHVLIFAGYDEDGTKLWCHCTSGSGVVLNTPSYADSLYYCRPNGVDYDAPLSDYVD